MTIQYCSDIVWSKDLYVYLFCFLPIFDREFFFLFCFLPMSNRELSFSFVFFRSLIENFLFFLLFLKRVSSSIVSDSSFLGDPTIPSSEGTDGNSHPGSRFMASWDFGSRLYRMAGHDICQGVGLASGSGIKECPTLFP